MYLNQIASYWNSRAEGYSLTIHEELKTETGTFYRSRLRAYAPEGESISCLDIGCGPGFFSILLAQLGYEVTAVDYSEQMLERARENFKELDVEVETLQCDAQSLPFPDESFDYVVSRNLMWNLEEPEKAYSEWLRVLKPGGRLLVDDGNHYLYYFDEDYLRAKDAERVEQHHNCCGVDPTPINEIARDLPLSREHRPYWDIKTLMGLGAIRFEAELGRKTFFDPVSGAGKSLISSFILCAEKPTTDPRLSAEEQQRRIDDQWTGASDNYSRIIHDELNSFRAEAWTKRILSNAPQKSELQILDAGCGPAFFSILLSRAGHRVVGLDGAAGMLKYATENAKQCGVSPLFIKGDCHELPFANDSFDLIVSRNVTHALRDHQRVYSEWFRVLRPGGRLLIFDANWHLMNTDPEIAEAFYRREDECFRVFGTNFNDGKREARGETRADQHRLGRVVRPDWDISVLQQAGFSEISFERNIIDGLWDDKEKLLYGETPMFMITAAKENV